VRTIRGLGLALVLLAAAPPPAAGQLRMGTPAPELSGGGGWINSAPLTLAALRGRVVAVEFWTYG
jgi:ABC-type nitrate/sulfonate/bicarbonate transport system substrate-binding protein